MPAQIGGEIGYLKLAEWWLSQFTEVERTYIESVYQPLGMSAEHPHPLTQGKVTFEGLTRVQLLSCLASWFRKSSDRYLARRMLQQAELELADELDILTVQLFWEVKREIYYAERENDAAALGIAIAACERQIAIAPQVAEAMKSNYSNSAFPKHGGYQLLVTIRAEQQDYAEAIRLCQLAKAQGWTGDWDQRMTQYLKAMNRLKVGDRQ